MAATTPAINPRWSLDVEITDLAAAGLPGTTLVAPRAGRDIFRDIPRPIKTTSH